jgi:hypothetical protein
LPIARRLPCIDQLIGATTILTYWPLSLQVIQALLKRTGDLMFQKHSQLFALIQVAPGADSHPDPLLGTGEASDGALCESLAVDHAVLRAC